MYIFKKLKAKHSINMVNWKQRIITSLGTALFLIFMLKYMHFSFWTLIVLPLLLGGLMWALEHRNFAIGIIIGTVLFTVFMSLFGWTFMEGWVKPEEYIK
jgi:hypothetical protein